MLEIKVCKLHF